MSEMIKAEKVERGMLIETGHGRAVVLEVLVTPVDTDEDDAGVYILTNSGRAVDVEMNLDMGADVEQVGWEDICTCQGECENAEEPYEAGVINPFGVTGW